MKKFLTIVFMSAAPPICVAQDIFFAQASETAHEIIAAKAKTICQPANIPKETRKALIAILTKIHTPGLTDAAGLTPLDYAVIADDVPSVKRLIQVGYPAKSADGTLLHGAALLGSKHVLLFLLSVQIDPDAANGYQSTPLMVAAAEGQLDIAQALIDAGASVNARNKDGGTALHYAIGCKNETLVDVLLAAGAVVDSKAMELASRYNVALKRHER